MPYWILDDAAHLIAAFLAHGRIALLQALLVADRHRLDDVVGDGAALTVVKIEEVVARLAAPNATKLVAQIARVLNSAVEAKGDYRIVDVRRVARKKDEPLAQGVAHALVHAIG